MSCVQVDNCGGYAMLKLNRPPVNAINRAVLDDLDGALGELENGGEALPFVFTATGSTFCAGLDLREIPTYSPAEQREFLQLCNSTAARLYRWPAPVVGAINGHAIAAGFVLALTPDYRITADGDIKFGVPEIKAGIPFPAVPLAIMNAELPQAVVRRMTITARNSSIKDAKHDGVVDEIVPDGRLQDRAAEMLAELSALPRDSYRRVKAQIRAEASAAIESILSTGGDPMMDAWLGVETSAAAANVLDR